ncbi:MAG: hypothetical protein PHG82_00635 [Candidatus Gracilibacteria bacterium]|nr:hypothetical protein [Candidatus Gracilibacteria bacterium]
MKIFLKIFLLSTLILPNFVFAANLGTDMLPNTNTIMGNSADIKGSGTNSLFPVLTEVKTIIFSLLALIAVAVFIYLGFKLVSAQGKPDEFKKAMMGFVYAIIGLAIIPLAWALVKLISSLQF